LEHDKTSTGPTFRDKIDDDYRSRCHATMSPRSRKEKKRKKKDPFVYFLCFVSLFISETQQQKKNGTSGRPSRKKQ